MCIRDSYFPAVEKGLQEAIEEGVLAGYPVVNLKATLVDGSYHAVDSNELSFKLAARLAYRAGLPQADPVLLEPIDKLMVHIPDDFLGDIMGDLNKRRGRIMGIHPDTIQGFQIVEAEAPRAEIAKYATDLKSMTQGRGWFTIEDVYKRQGHGGVGKTAFVEAALYNAGVIDRMGRSNDGNTVTDFDAEEMRRGLSISTSVAWCEWKKHKLNFIDTPGDFDFLGEQILGMFAGDTALIVMSAKDGCLLYTSRCV